MRRRAANAGHVVRIDAAQKRATIRKRAMGLTEEERQLILAELAEIAAELDELQSRTAEIAARVDAESARLPRPA